MTPLQRLELKILELLNRLNLRMAFSVAIELGERLIEAKAQMGHGEWLPWLSRLGLRKRNAQLYMFAAREEAKANSPLPEFLTLEGFLRRCRHAKRAARRAEMDHARQVAIDADLPTDEQYRVFHADCRKHEWPKQIDVIATDPPWHDLDSYRWLGNLANSHLREGGLLLAQCGQFRLPDVLDVLRQSGLIWQWMLDIVYPTGSSQVKPVWLCNWRPVVVFTKGNLDQKSILPLSDTYTVGRHTKVLHPWEQPLDAWDYWIKRLAPPGSLIADPYCGSGTIGLAVKNNAEGRRYLGTDNDLDHVKVARHRLVEQVE